MTAERHRFLPTLPADELSLALFDEMGDALFLVNPDHQHILDANPTAEKLCGLTHEQLIGAPIHHLLQSETEDSSWVLAMRRTQSFHGKGPYKLRVAPEDDWIPVSLTISRLHFSTEGPLALLTARDLRDLLRLSRQLEMTETELQEVLVSVADCVWSAIVTPDGSLRYLYLSPVAERLLGLPLRELLHDAERWTSRVHPEDRSAYQGFLAQLRAGQPAEVDYRVRLPDGQLRWLSERVQVRGHLSRDRTRLFGVLSDSSSRRLAEEQLRSIDRQLGELQRHEGIAQLAGGVAHDFNNLLTPILGFAELIRTQLGPDHPGQPFLEHISQAARRGAELTHQMLAYAGRGLPQIKPLDLGALVTAMLPLLQRLLPPHATLIREFTPELPLLDADENQLRQVLVNLVTNAAEALDDDGGTITLRLGHDDLANPAALASVSLGYLAPGPYLSLEVADTGCGIAPAILARIFDPFFTTKFVGRGLGLASTLGIVRSHHGFVHVQSQPRVGSRFRLYFPCSAHPGKSTPLPEVSPEAPRIRSGTLLVLDDEVSVRKITQRLLEALGYCVLTSPLAVDVVTLIRMTEPAVSLILLDTGLTGTAAAGILDQLETAGLTIPILLVSGYNNGEFKERFKDRRIAGFLQKPFTSEDLAKQIHSLG